MRYPPVVLLLRILLALLFVALTLGQTFSFPGQFAHMAQESPELAHLRWPLTALAALGLLCGQVVIVATWRLLTLVHHDRIFSEESFAWVDAIVAAVGVAWLLVTGLFLFVGFRADDPGGPAVLMVMSLATAVVGLLMLVMRSLLRRATTLRTEMDAVI